MARLQRKKASGSKKKTGTKKAESPAVGHAVAAQKPMVMKSTAADSRRRAAPVSKQKTAAKGKKNYIDSALQFLREVRVELKKVTWPSRKQTLGSTTVVVILVLLISLFLGLVDVILSSLVKLVLA